MSMMPGYPVPRTQWTVSGEACTACGKRFSFFTSKENCPCCGHLFCSACLAAECTLTPNGLSTAVCLDCFQKIQDWRRAQREQRINAAALVAPPTASPPVATSAASLSTPSASPPIAAAEAVASSVLSQKVASLDGDVTRAKALARQLREENDALIDLLAAKDTCIVELTEKRRKADTTADAAAASAEKCQQQVRDVTASRTEATKALGEVQEKLSVAQETNESLMERLEEMTEANARLKARIGRLEDTIQEQAAQFAQDTEELRRLESQLKAANAAGRAEHHIPAEHLQSDLQTLAEEKARLQTRSSELQAQVDSLAVELGEVRAAEQVHISTMATYEDEMKRLQAAAETATTASADLQQRLRDQRQQHEGAIKAAKDAATAEVSARQRLVDSLNEQLHASAVALQEMQQRNGELEDALSEERHTRADAEKQIRTLQEDVDTYRQQADARDATERTHRAQVQMLEDAVCRARHEAAEAPRQLHDSRQQQSEVATTSAQDTVTAGLAEKQHLIDSLQDQLEVARAETAQVRVDCETAHSERTQEQQARSVLQARAENLEAALQALRASEQRWHATEAKYEEEVHRLRATLDTATKEAASLQQQVDESHLHQSCAVQEAQRTSAAVLAERQRSMDGLQEQLEASKAAVKELQEQKNVLTEQLRSQQAALHAAESQRAALARKVVDYDTQAEVWKAAQACHSTQLHELQGAALQAQKERVAVQQELDGMRHKQHEVDTTAQSVAAKELSKKQEVIESLHRQLEEVHTTLTQSQQQVDALQHEHANAQEGRDKAQSRANDLEAEVRELRAHEVPLPAATAAAHEKEVLRLRTALEAAAQESKALQQQLEETQHQHSAAAAEAEAAMSSGAREKQQMISSFCEKLDAAKATGKELQQQKESLEDDLEHQQRACGKAEAQLNALKLEVDRYRRQAAEWEATMKDCDAQTQKLQQTVSQTKQESAAAQEQLHGTQQRLAQLQRQTKNTLQNFRAQLAAIKDAQGTEQQAYQTSLTELRSALEQLEKCQEAEGITAAVAAPEAMHSDMLPLPPVVSSVSDQHPSSARWARPTRVKDIQYPPLDIPLPDIYPIPGLDRWEFDTKAEATRVTAPDALVRIGWQIAHDWGLFSDDEALGTWVRFLEAVQLNYADTPYHNKVHAADVLQGVYALTAQCPALFMHMTRVEKRAIVFAAAVHDLRHPGRTEQFLRQTFDATYLHYNGCTVLEQMHTATAFQLLGVPALDFTQADMSDHEALRFHSLVTSLIACTFMGSHVSLMETWTQPLRREGGAYDFTKEEDRQTVLGMVLHAADVGAPSRGAAVALKWLDVVEEMYQQGDEEAALGLPIGMGCSRGGSLEKGQLFFLETFVIPLFAVLHQIFPSMDRPLVNLKALHKHYCDAAHESTRPFPSLAQYGAAAAPSETQKAKETVALERRRAQLEAREATVERKEKMLAQAVQRLRQAATAVAQREAQLHRNEAQTSDKEARLAAVEQRVAAQLTALETAARQPEKEPLPASSRTEAELLRATAAVVQREEAVQQRARELEKLTAELEEREAVASQLSTQLAAIAEKVNRRRQQLRYREAQQAAGLRVQSVTDRSVSPEVLGTAVTSPASLSHKANSAPPQCRGASLSPSVEAVKLESVLLKLNAALSYT